jgi:hypothetical protein
MLALLILLSIWLLLEAVAVVLVEVEVVALVAC